MAMGRQKDGQGDLMVSWSEMPRSPGHVFYDRLQSVLIEGGFDAFAEASCRPYYAARMGAPSVPPGRYFRMHLVGYFEGIDSERGLEWRCSDSLSLRAFLRLGSRDRVPDHSWLSRSRTRLPHEVHAAVFDWVLVLIAEAGLIKGERIGVDASTMEANAALRNIVRRDNGEGYREMLERLARESGVETPTAESLARLERKRKGKKLSNTDWVSKSDPEAKIAKMKDGTTHLAYKPEHAVDLDTGAVVAAELHPADEGDTTTLSKTLAKAEANLEAVDAAPTPEDPAECVADKGYHSRAVLRALNDSPWKTRIAAPKQTGFSRWHGDEAARRAVTNNRAWLKSGVAREAFKLRAEIVERCFAHNLDRGGMRRTWLRGRENVHKRYLLHVAGHNLSLLMRQLIGTGTPREAVAGGYGGIFVLLTPTGAMLVARGAGKSHLINGLLGEAFGIGAGVRRYLHIGTICGLETFQKFADLTGRNGARNLIVAHSGPDSAQHAANAQRNLARLFGDGDDVALGLTLDTKIGIRIMQHHRLLAVQSNENDVWVRRRFRERTISHKARLLRDRRDMREDVGPDPFRFDQCGHVRASRSFLQCLEPVGQGTDATVAMILGNRREGVVTSFNPEHASRRDPTRAAIRRGLWHRRTEPRHTFWRSG